MRRLEVRCCCQPSKLLGSLPVMDSQCVIGARLRFPLMRPPQRNAFVSNPRLPKLRDLQDLEFEVALWADVELDLVTGEHKRDDRGLALRHDNVTLEQLRLIPGFIEARDRHQMVSDIAAANLLDYAEKMKASKP